MPFMRQMNLPIELPKINLAVQFLESENSNIEEWDGECYAVCDEVLERYPHGHVVYVDGDAVEQYGWWYHQVPYIDGLIHDAWLAGWQQIPEPLPLEEWLVKMFGTDDEVDVTINGEPIYRGLPQNFRGQNPARRGSVHEIVY